MRPNQPALAAASDFTIKYVLQGEIRSGGDEPFCLVYRGEDNFYFYGVPFRTKEGSIIRIELQIPKAFRNIEDPAVRCLILKRVRDYAKNSTFSLVRNASTGAIDAEILSLERTA